MSKLCKFCGAEMDDEAFECPECLKKIPGAELLAKQKAIEKKQKLKSRLTTAGIVLGGIAIITALVAIVTTLNKKPSDLYGKPIETYIESCVENNYKKHMSAFTGYMGTFLAQQYSYYVMGQIPEDDTKVQTAAILYLDAYYQDLIAKYGTDVEITYDINDEKRYTSEELQKYQEEYISFYKDGLAGTVFSDGYELVLTFYIDGMLAKNTIVEPGFQVFEIDDEWYIMRTVDFFQEEEAPDVETYK